MKKIILFVLVATFLFSCNDFINLTPVSQQNTSNFYKNIDEIDQALTAAYSSLRAADQYGSDKGYASFMEVNSDNTWNENITMDGGSFASFDNFTMNADNPQLSRTWISCYNGIQRCNLVITRLQKLEGIDPVLKDRKMGEALFLRALTYFNIVRIWGDVPLITAEVENVNDAFEHTRETADNVYNQIISDLQSAASQLPASYDAANIGRATKGAAQTLLAKVYLTQRKWNQALQLLRSVISSGTYDLIETRFADVFSVDNKNNQESIFELQYDKTLEGQGYTGPDPLIKTFDINNLPSDNLRNLFVANPDDRAAASIVNLSGFGWRLYKWHDTKGANNGLGFNLILLRYADVLLMASEVMNEIEYGQEDALTYLNKVRLRSHAIAYTPDDLPTKEAFREAIAKERRLEFAFENQRWFDLLRTGKAIEVMNSSVGASKLPIKMQEHFLIFPIPQSQIDASAGKITQNPKY